MTDRVYIPNLKTSDSELRALRHLSPAVKNRILPAFELTRSRVTPKLPEGSVIRRAEQLVENYGDSNFILDLTTENDLLNPEMDKFYDERNGYSNWRSFLGRAFPSEIIPCLQYVEGGSELEFKRQVAGLIERYGKVALRTSVSDLEANELYKWSIEVTSLKNITVIGSIYFLDQQSDEVYFDRCRRFLSTVVGNQVPDVIAFPGSSFPKSVGMGVYGNDDGGNFPALELPLFERLKTTFANMPLVYSDYASVHPIRYPSRGGSWVPRIDIFQNGQFTFSRLRNQDGGYAEAAKIIMRNYGGTLPSCWGAEQIKQAAGGTVPGKSPSFWISARINMWITQRANELSST
jgi:hypothetical protein